jgi:hypothetical protein
MWRIIGDDGAFKSAKIARSREFSSRECLPLHSSIHASWNPAGEGKNEKKERGIRRMAGKNRLSRLVIIIAIDILGEIILHSPKLTWIILVRE